jgi:hypothetical protein
MATAIFVGVVGAIVATLGGSYVVSLYMKTFATKLDEAHQRITRVEHKTAQKNEIITEPPVEYKASTINALSSERCFPDGGKLIGQLERFLIYLFILSGNPAGVGFLVTAKSVFRFGELTSNENRMEAEYITIGTMMSFSWGLAVSLLAKLLIDASLK